MQTLQDDKIAAEMMTPQESKITREGDCEGNYMQQRQQQQPLCVSFTLSSEPVSSVVNVYEVTKKIRERMNTFLVLKTWCKSRFVADVSCNFWLTNCCVSRNSVSRSLRAFAFSIFNFVFASSTQSGDVAVIVGYSLSGESWVTVLQETKNMPHKGFCFRIRRTACSASSLRVTRSDSVRGDYHQLIRGETSEKFNSRRRRDWDFKARKERHSLEENNSHKKVLNVKSWRVKL